MPVFKVEVDDETAAAVADLRARNSDVSAPDFWRATLHRGLDMMLAFERTDLARASPEAAEEEAVADAARWAAEAIIPE